MPLLIGKGNQRLKNTTGRYTQQRRNLVCRVDCLWITKGCVGNLMLIKETHSVCLHFVLLCHFTKSSSTGLVPADVAQCLRYLLPGARDRRDELGLFGATAFARSAN